MVDDIEEKQYAPFLTNKALSYHQDAVYFANEMNIRHGVDNRLQYLFYLNILRKRQRFSSWSKPYSSNKLETIKDYYKVSNLKAKEYADVLTDKQVRELKKRMVKGGKDYGK